MIRASDSPMPRKISNAQTRAARALIRWTALDLAHAPKVGVATIRSHDSKAEAIDGEIPGVLANEAAIRCAFEIAGIEFIEDNEGGEGRPAAVQNENKQARAVLQIQADGAGARGLFANLCQHAGLMSWFQRALLFDQIASNLRRSRRGKFQPHARRR
jgi:hypothetical protein